jgi:hypothetical protein
MSKQIEMEKEVEIETELGIKKKHPTPPQIETTTNTPKVSPNSMNSSFKKNPPFPFSSSRFSSIDAIKQISKYAKFLMELCTTKRAYKLKGYEMVSMGEVVSDVVQKNRHMK